MSDDFFNQNAEIAVLSLMLKFPDSLEKVKDLNSNMFSSNSNKILYELILKTYGDGLTPDYSLIMTTLKTKNLLGIAGGEAYIQYLYGQNYDANNLDEFIRLVMESYKYRRLISIFSSIPDIVKNGHDTGKIISDLRTELDDLSSFGDMDRVVSFQNAAKTTYEVIVDRVANPEKIKYSTGLKSLDGATGGYWEGDLWVVAGRPGMGKSAYICNSVLSGIPSLIFSLEMSKEVITQRILAMRTGIPVFNIRMGLLNQKELDIIADMIRQLKDLPLFIDARYFVSPEYLSSTIRKYVSKFGVKLVFLDYVQLVIERSINATHDIGRLTREFKLISNELQITTVMASQLNRLVEMRDDKRPILSDLRQSGNIEEDVDVALFLYRDFLYNKGTKDKDILELLIRKQRNGPQGVLMSKFDDQTNRIYDK